MNFCCVNNCAELPREVSRCNCPEIHYYTLSSNVTELTHYMIIKCRPAFLMWVQSEMMPPICFVFFLNQLFYKTMPGEGVCSSHIDRSAVLADGSTGLREQTRDPEGGCWG